MERTMTMTNRNVEVELDMDTIYRIELEARQMRARAVNEGLIAFGQFLRKRWNALRGTAGHQAA